MRENHHRKAANQKSANLGRHINYRTNHTPTCHSSVPFLHWQKQTTMSFSKKNLSRDFLSFRSSSSNVEDDDEKKGETEEYHEEIDPVRDDILAAVAREDWYQVSVACWCCNGLVLVVDDDLFVMRYLL